MGQLLEFKSGNGIVLIEVEQILPSSENGLAKVGPEDDVPSTVVAKAATDFSSALGVIRHTAAALIDQIKEMAVPPTSVEVSFGLKAAGEAGLFFITKASGEANFTVTLEWKQPEPGGKRAEPKDRSDDK